ncbi:FadR/GntR family transcriptional regulator [Georgenia deserti]|uniref:FadR/GntR family transcriptional regulator n=1 Tax=Georgenia deserti TaxID=2093781 RepID=A0ABW4L9W2_9MICO
MSTPEPNAATPLRHVHVLNGLGADIVAGRLEPGTSVTLDQLQDRYGASRGLVRECMRILEGLGMLRSQRRTGIEIRPPESWNAYDPMIIRWRLEGPDREEQLQVLTELRLGLEPVASRLAALRAAEDERDELREVMAMLRANGEAGRQSRHLDADLRFHAVIMTASHNPMYTAMVPVVREVLQARRRHEEIDRPHVLAALDRHERVARAVLAGDEQEAELAMHDLLAEVRQTLSAD